MPHATRKKLLLALAILLALAAIAALAIFQPYANLGAAYAAKVMAGGLFVANRDAETLQRVEMAFLPPGIRYGINHDAKTVTASFLGLFPQTALFREGLGTTIANAPIGQLRAQAIPGLFQPLQGLQEKPWPTGDAPSGNPRPAGIDETALAEAMDHAFAQTSPEMERGTRAVAVVYMGELVAERYAPGFGPETRLIGWSMTKSITSALIGILVKQGKLDIAQPAPIEEWHGTDDPRGAITLDMLLRMSSGLEFDENYYSPFADASPMLFHNYSTAQYAIDKPLQYPPDTKWYYSSGTTNILQEIIRRTIGNDGEYHHFPYRELFAKIGMRGALLEADSSGTFVGSSFFYATARDYARFGLLYAQDGVWQGERILPEGWVVYSRTPTHTDPVKRYAAQWWLPFPDQFEEARGAGVEIPEDTFCAAGHEGQFIYVIPSRQLVAVRLGLSADEDRRFTSTLIRLLKAIPE